MADQLPAKLNNRCVAGQPFSLEIVCTGATVTSGVVTVYTAFGVEYLTAVGPPTVGTSASTISVDWSAQDTTDLFALKGARKATTFYYQVAATVDGVSGALVGGKLVVEPPGTAGVSTSATENLTVNVGDVTVSLAVTVGAGVAAHIVDTDGAHAASAISVLDTAGNFTGANVETVLAELAASGGPEFDVTQYGADPSGVADSFDEIRAAQTAASAANGTLYFPAGVYDANVPTGQALLTVTGTMRTIVGQGSGCTQINNTGAGRLLDVGVYDTFETTPAFIGGLTFEGNASSDVNIRGRNYSKVSMVDVRTDNSGSHGMDLRNCNNWRIHRLRSDNNTGAGVFGDYSTSRDAGDGGASEASSANHHLAFVGAIIENNDGDGMTLSNATSLHFEGVVQGNGGDGLDLVGINTLNIHGYFEANLGTQISLGTGQTTGVTSAKILAFVQKGAGGDRGIYAYRCKDVEIDGTFSGYTAGGTVASIYLDTLHTGTIQGVHSGGGTFIRRFDGTNITASNGVFQFGQERIIYFANSGDHNGTDNAIMDITNVGTRDVGVKLTGAWLQLWTATTTLPTAAIGERGKTRVLTNAGAVADQVVYCLRKADGSYAWFAANLTEI